MIERSEFRDTSCHTPWETAFGGLSPSLRLAYRFAGGTVIEGTAGYVHDARSLRFGGGGSEAYTTLRAVFGLVSVSRPF